MFIFTYHGVEQFITRYNRTLDHRQARHVLLDAIRQGCTRLEKKTLDGADQWFVPSLDMVLITRPDKKCKKHVIVTVVTSKHLGNPTTDAHRIREDPTLGRSAEDLLYAPPLHSDVTKSIRFVLDIEFDYTEWGSRDKFLAWMQQVITCNVTNLRRDGMGKVVRARLLEVKNAS